MILLAALGGLGIVGHLFGGVSMFLAGQGTSLLAGVLIWLLFLALVSTGIMFWRTRENPRARGFGRVALGTLQLMGALMAGWLILILATFIFFFAVCFGGGLKF
jgi:hypothetical protein